MPSLYDVDDVYRLCICHYRNTKGKSDFQITPTKAATDLNLSPLTYEGVGSACTNYQTVRMFLLRS